MSDFLFMVYFFISAFNFFTSRDFLRAAVFFLIAPLATARSSNFITFNTDVFASSIFFASISRRLALIDILSVPFVCLLRAALFLLCLSALKAAFLIGILFVKLKIKKFGN